MKLLASTVVASLSSHFGNLRKPAPIIAGPFPLLALTVTLPLWVVAWGQTASGGLFVLYRAPKLAALQILLWSLLLVLAWGRGGHLELGRAWRDPVIAAFGLFVAYGAASLLWAEVPANGLYELAQWLPLFLLLVALRGWLARDPGLADRLIIVLALAMLPVVAVSGLQLLRPLPWLPAINPDLGVVHASLLGYKNPLALTLLGQIFLVAYLAIGRRRPHLGWLTVLLAEVALLATLRSRTAMVALLVATILGSALLALRGRRRPALAVAAAGLLFVALLAALPAARQRAATIPPLLAQYWQSDRGIYLRNTLEMVRQHPAGVGLGNWQTAYPVFRKHDRFRSFDREFRVRRAHSDHVQILGETGWPGIALWSILLVVAGQRALRGGPRDTFVLLQLGALVLAMAADYVLDLPYSKLQLILLLALLPAAKLGPRGAPGRHLPWLLPLAVTGLISASLLAVKSHRGAHFQVAYSSGHTAARDLGEAFARLPGHDKTFHRHLLALAELRWQAGDAAGARQAARRALALHPYDPTALRLLAIFTRPRDPLAAATLEDAAAYILHEATNGYRKPYPSP